MMELERSETCRGYK